MKKASEGSHWQYVEGDKTKGGAKKVLAPELILL